MTHSPKAAGVLAYRAQLFVYSQDRAENGIWFQVPPTVLAASVSHEELGHAVRAALDCSKPIPVQSDDEQIARNRRLLEVYQVPNWAELYRSCQACAVFEWEAGVLTVSPRRAQAGGLVRVRELEEKVSADLSDEALGGAVRRAIELS